MSVQAISNTDLLQLHVRLLNEGTDVFRPVWAEPLGGGVYELVAAPDYDPEDEEWEFEPGSHVVAASWQGKSGDFLIAAPMTATELTPEIAPLSLPKHPQTKGLR